MRQFFLYVLIAVQILTVSAQIPSGYYSAAVGKTEAALKTQLNSIISTGYVSKSYDYLYTIYSTSDVTSAGNVWDMYSTCTWTPGQKKCGNYSVVCDCYNREHSIPQSWFNEASPMVSDAFHVYPTDGKVNGQRSNYPFGECTGGTTLSGGKGRLGACTFAGYSGTVFEPVDEYKGDFARTYFYFTTRYMNTAVTAGGGVFGSTFGDLKSWCVDLYLKWSRQDPVSKKEIDRNNAVYAHQKNRNPFIDYPELAEYIWGNKKGSPWSLTSGINDLKVDFNIIQVPKSSILRVITNEEQGVYRLLSVNAVVVKTGKISQNTDIEISDLQHGMYFIEIQAESRKSIKKFVAGN